MLHLKLVAGTAVSSVARTETDTPARRSIEAGGGSETLESQARAMISSLRPGLDGKSVEELLAEMCRNLESDRPQMQTIQRNGVIRRTLLSIGIHPHPSSPAQELDVALYGLVIDRKKMLKTCPALAPCAQVLDGLTL